MPAATASNSVSGDGESGSLEHVRSIEAFPKHSPQRVTSMGELEGLSGTGAGPHAPNAQVETPFPLLPGEFVKHFGMASQGTHLYLTNYRLFILLDNQGFHNVSLPCIDFVEVRDLFYLLTTCKDGRMLKIVCENNEKCLMWLKLLLTAISTGVQKRDQVFAFAFYAWCTDEKRQMQLGLRYLDGYDAQKSTVVSEFKRLQYDESIWRIAEQAESFKLCETYPRYLIVPRQTKDAELQNCARHRFLNRMPAVVWRHAKGSVLLRSSQPSSGFFGWRSTDDELFLQAVLTATAAKPPPIHRSNGHLPSVVAVNTPAASASDSQANSSTCTKTMLILDARSYTAAWANRAKGGGFESPEYYQKCEVQFMGLANIHAIRNSFQQLRTLLATETPDSSTWLQTLQTTQWLQHLSSLFSTALRVVEALDYNGRSVLVHCSDGWDRTTQIVSLAKLLIDPYYRTMRGFRELVDREWIEFGHKFADRCGLTNQNTNERSPVFLQWLDCVHQLWNQFPASFEFNNAYLVKLAQHAYSALFGNFLCNSAEEMAAHRVYQSTFSVWQYLHPDNAQFRNVIYDSDDAAGAGASAAAAAAKILYPQHQIRDMRLWREIYCCSEPVGLSRPRSGSLQSVSMDRSLTRAHSADSLTSIGDPSNPAGAGAGVPILAASTVAIPTLPVPGSSSSAAITNHNTLVRTGSDSSLTASSPPILSPIASWSRNEGINLQMGDEPDPVSLVLDNVLRKVSESESESFLLEDATKSIAGMDLSPSFNPSPLALASRPPPPPEKDLNSNDDVDFSFDIPDSVSSSQFHAVAGIPGIPSAAASTICDDELNSLCNMSTSTSDISDSMVHRTLLHHIPLSQHAQVRCCEHVSRTANANVNVNHKSRANGYVKLSASPSSTSTLVWHGSNSNSSLNSQTESKPKRKRQVADWLDADGLTSVPDALQDRMRRVLACYKHHINTLDCEVQRLRSALKYQNGCLHHHPHPIQLPTSSIDKEESNGDLFEPHSYDSNGAASDISWEAVEEGETQPTRWVPDHAVSHCMGCDSTFWTINRRHHCRSCGKVFCSACSSYECPVPTEQLYEPVRVCSTCYDVLRSRGISASS